MQQEEVKTDHNMTLATVPVCQIKLTSFIYGVRVRFSFRIVLF